MILWKKNNFPRLETEVLVNQFTLQEVAKFKAADPDDVVSVRVCETIEFIEQYEQLSKDYARVTADKVRLQEDNAGLQEDKVRLEEEIAEYKSNVAVLEQRISDLDVVAN